MTKLEQAALDLLEGVEAAIKAGDWKVDGACDPDLAMYRLREALAEQADEIDWIETNKALAKEIIELKKQAEQEPVASMFEWKNGNPVRTKDLTDDEIWKVIDTVNPSAHIEDLNPFSLARAVITADREKNK